MKTLKVIILLGVLITSVKAAPTWVTSSMPGGFAARTGSVAFSIGTKGYVGTGTKQISGTDTDFRDFWEYNSLTDTWTQKSDFAASSPGLGGRKNGLGFSIGTKGYIGTGGNYSGNNLVDFWEYDPATNVWTQKANFAGVIDDRGIAFSIGTKGYIRSGNTTAMAARTSFWSYDQVLDTWSQETDLGSGMTGVVLRGASAFAINSKGYLGTGLDGTNTRRKDFYEYDPAAKVWVQKADFSGSARFNAVHCATSTKGYIGLGYDTDVSERRSMWEYDPTANSGAGAWTQILDYPIPANGISRSQAFGFTVGNNLFVGGGNWDVGNPSNYYSDFYGYYPAGAPVLPVELITMNAIADAQKEQVLVNWETATEKESDYFAIERRVKLSDQFQEIGRINGSGNSSKTLVYNFIDEKPVRGIDYYRLRIVDIDGKITYSKTVSVSLKNGSKIKVYPTITEGSVTIENGDKSIDNVYVWNASGQLMMQSKQMQMDLSALPRGLYLVQVKAGSEQFVAKITKR